MRDRWRAVGALTAISCLTVASCDGDVGDENQGPQQVEVYSWGSSESQRLAFDDLSAEFEENHPDLQVVNPAEEMESRDQAQSILESRLSQGDPPAAFQSRAGAGLSDYVEDGYVAPLDDVYDATSLADALPEELVEQLAYRGTVGEDQEPDGDEESGNGDEPVPDAEDGPFYTVPVSIRRSNLLWYNPDVLEDAGVRGAVTTLGDFLDALEAVEEETNAVPLALGPGWTVDHLLENMLLASLGAEEYNELWGPTADWTTTEVEEALDVFSEVLEHTEQIDEDQGWQGAAEAVADGSAAFFVMGDWAVAHYEEMGLVPREDYGWVPTPGTEGVYLWLADGFSRPAGAGDGSGDADAWLEFAASREGQDVINPAVGAIPARTDADLEAYTESEYLSWALAQWQEAELAGSFWHGASASVTWREGVDSALRTYLRDEDIAAFQDELEAQARDASAHLIDAPAED
ncbi:carbohydrate ABC transporter substrate-binding protein [Spiractinospora alimapuensis]|uniref:ABC transporter substrate-binding protein n=1 Tax=Spiractinospora alimapuensis TaxID=2820884 RepID=UPI001F36C048|nr:ABC transporter substrate-binding protein [Spiractinospora alimapuensis]QVQ52033.1 carbohydrate ABC transporter substrate-binding protein [Spiractinospora alimapuensis]